jgi:hypothetical protein
MRLAKNCATILIGLSAVTIAYARHLKTRDEIPYKQVSITQMTAENPVSWKVINTHTSVTGFIIDWRYPNDFDGDTHVVVCDSPKFKATGDTSLPDVKHCIIAEMTPYLHCDRVAPSGKPVTFYGQAHYDGEHHWWELHPLEKNSASECRLVEDGHSEMR